ncbi:DUF4440 domain-containing protein [Devosia sediminis]|uniref:DUF4440 domain-containing protein n=1 Tax=Devosia sediminis TaxID=2798801 RepID=A0A934IYA7_9HYPH|nr:DUF4440 domain-containing protein [Devosia sediminis]MBJ3784169.1 DUF4440 domain-containing protein [Devosia sediminis]
MHEVWNIERSLWLDGVDAYRARLADQCVMAFGPMGILDREQVLQTIEQAPRWASVEISETRLTTPGDTIAIVIAYKAEAMRDGGKPYRALCSSTYLVLDGELKLAQHQQTPL